MTDRIRIARKKGQQGATLLIAMIFMIVLMLIVASAVKTTNVNTRVAGNMQAEQEGAAAGQQMIEHVITGDLGAIPATQTFSVDINESGQDGAKYTVKVDAECIQIKPIPQLALNLSNPNDVACLQSGAMQPNMPSSGNSLCSESVWNIKATSKSSSSDQPVYVQSQGVTQRVGGGGTC